MRDRVDAPNQLGVRGFVSTQRLIGDAQNIEQQINGGQRPAHIAPERLLLDRTLHARKRSEVADKLKRCLRLRFSLNGGMTSALNIRSYRDPASMSAYPTVRIVSNWQ